MTLRLNLLLLVLALALGGPFYWLLLDNPPRDAQPMPLSVAQLRGLADALPGEPPAGIGVRLLGWDRSSGNLLAAGAGIKRRLYRVNGFRVQLPGRGPVMIDTGMTVAQAQVRQVEALSASRMRLHQRDLRRASVIVATDAIPEALGGLADLAGQANPDSALAAVRLNPGQIPAVTRQTGLGWPAGLSLPATIPAGRPRAVAPGVVVIPTGAPTAGSQMVYVRLAGGREYLLAGPVAPYAISLAELRTRSRLLDLVEGRQDRKGTMRWLVTLRRWQREAPGLVVVPGHELGPLNGATGPAALRTID